MYKIDTCKLAVFSILPLLSVVQLSSPAAGDDLLAPAPFDQSETVWEIHEEEADLSVLEDGGANAISGTNPFSPNSELPPVEFSGSERSDFIDIDLSAVPEEFHPIFERAELFYETNFEISAENSELYAAAELPAQITIDAALADLEPGIAGSAGPTFGVFNLDDNGEVIVDGGSVVVPTEGTMEFDTEFIQQAVDLNIIDALIIHEMGHVLGFGTLWEFNGLIAADGTYPERNVFSGAPTSAVRMYVLEAQEVAQQIPLENEGGPGTVESHWDKDKPIFGANSADANEVMVGFLSLEPYMSRISMEAFDDLGYSYRGSVLD